MPLLEIENLTVEFPTRRKLFTAEKASPFLCNPLRDALNPRQR